MTNDNRLLESILNSGREQAGAIMDEAREKAAEIMDEAKKTASLNAEELNKNAQEKASNMKKSAESSASLIERNALLTAKREEIDKTLEGISSYICALPDADYFELLYRMAEGVAEKEGVVSLNENDLKRLPKDFEARFKKAGVSVTTDTKPCDITGGFILRCGEIEVNCSLTAVIEDRKNELEDFINRSLFGKEEQGGTIV